MTDQEALIERMREAANRIYPWTRPIAPEPVEPVAGVTPRRHDYSMGRPPLNTPAGNPPSTGSEQDETRSK